MYHAWPPLHEFTYLITGIAMKRAFLPLKCMELELIQIIIHMEHDV